MLKTRIEFTFEGCNEPSKHITDSEEFPDIIDAAYPVAKAYIAQHKCRAVVVWIRITKRDCEIYEADKDMKAKMFDEVEEENARLKKAISSLAAIVKNQKEIAEVLEEFEPEETEKTEEAEE